MQRTLCSMSVWKSVETLPNLHPERIRQKSICLRNNIKHQTPQSSSKITPLRVVFLTLFSVFDLVMKHVSLESLHAFLFSKISTSLNPSDVKVDAIPRTFISWTF